MLKRVKILKIGLSVLSALLVLQLIRMWYPGEKAGYTEEVYPPPADGEMAGPAMDAEEEITRASYEVIARKNVFNSERKEFRAVGGEPGRSAKTARKQADTKKLDNLAVEGVVIFEGYNVAFIRDLTNPGEGSRDIKVGDRIEEFEVVSITEKEITFKGPDGTMKAVQVSGSNTGAGRGSLGGQGRNASTTTTAPTAPERYRLRPRPKGGS